MEMGDLKKNGDAGSMHFRFITVTMKIKKSCMSRYINSNLSLRGLVANSVSKYY